MSETELLARAVEELHEPDRLVDLLAAGLAREDAPADLVAQAQDLQAAIHAWQERHAS